jgi:hypothetical protein
MITGDDVLAAAAACRGFLRESADADWTAPVPGLDFTVRSVTAHAVNCVLWYAVDVWGGTDGDSPLDLKVSAETASSTLLPVTTRGGRCCGPTTASTCPGVPASTAGPGTAHRSPTGTASRPRFPRKFTRHVRSR